MFLLQKCGVGFAQHLKAQSTVLNKGDFKDLESSIVDKSPGTPFTLVFYCDEVTPGNQLKHA